MSARRWAPILDHAADVVRSYDTGVTLRQLFYRLVAAGLLPKTSDAYKSLSSRTAVGRREGTFPDLFDRTHTIHRHRTFAGPAEAREWLAGVYRRDRTEGQAVSVYVGVAKATMVNQLTAWFGDYGIPVVALGG